MFATPSSQKHDLYVSDWLQRTPSGPPDVELLSLLSSSEASISGKDLARHPHSDPTVEDIAKFLNAHPEETPEDFYNEFHVHPVVLTWTTHEVKSMH